MDDKDRKIADFFSWVTERISIQQKKDRGEPWPWTEDRILQEYKFTNVFRELDRTTIWFREHIRDPLKDDPRVYMATVIFRWFNLIETGETLLKHNLHIKWDPEKAFKAILPQDKWITGAYMIKSPTGKNKIRGICETVTSLWDHQQTFLKKHPWNTLQGMSKFLEGYPFLGPFLAYEITTDLRHTVFGREATDINTWANAGPGAMRGLNRIHGRELTYTSTRHDWCAEMRELLLLLLRHDIRYSHSSKYVRGASRVLELRDIEHSLCEFDKYERVRLNQGAPRSKYTYKGKK